MDTNDFLPMSGLDNLGEPYYMTGKYSHRPLFKQHINAFSNLVQNSLTFYAFDILNQKGQKPLTATDLHQKGSSTETEFTRRVDIRNGRSVVDDMTEMQALLASESLASGISARAVLNTAELQMNNLMQSKNNDILSESLNKLILRQDGIQIQSLY